MNKTIVLEIQFLWQELYISRGLPNDSIKRTPRVSFFLEIYAKSVS